MSSAPADGSEPSHPRPVVTEDALVRAFDPLVQARARQFARRPDLVDDLAQTGRLGVLRAVRSLGTDAVAHAVAADDIAARRARAYVTRAVQNALLDSVRGDRPTQDPERLPEEAGDDRVQIDLGLDLRGALDALTAKQADAVHALAHGLSLRQAAEFLNVSLAAVRERRDGAFAKLRPRLASYAHLVA